MSCLNLQLQACSPTLDTIDMLNWGSKITKLHVLSKLMELYGLTGMDGGNGWSEKDLVELKE